MEQNQQALPQARTMDLVTRDMPDELLVYDLKRHKAHCLNQTAATAWKHCDGNKSVAEIASAMESDLNVGVDESTVWLAVDQLGKANLLEARVTPPAGTATMSRREMMRKLRAGALLAAPLVVSIIAPTAALALSCFDIMNNANQNPVSCPCNGNMDCATMCCGVGPVCVAMDSVPAGGMCLRSCECAGMTMCTGGVCA